ncbi:MAG: mechanosensitive ion channel [Planctomycetes bacterium]|nr:mechanosensitive ion channel [Planctomycetota bacterium]
MCAFLVLVPGRILPALAVGNAGGVAFALVGLVVTGLLLAVLVRFALPALVRFAQEDPDAPCVRRIRLACVGLCGLTLPAIFLLARSLLEEWYAPPVVALYVFLYAFLLTELGLLGIAGVAARGDNKFPALFRDILRIVIYVSTFVVLLRTVFGVGDLGALLGASAVFSIIIGLAVQDTLGSVFAGLFLEIDRPFRVGDWVIVNGREGRVAEVNWRSTRLITRDNDSVSIPNSALSKGDVLNYSAPTVVHRVQKRVAVSFAAQPNKVKKIILEAMTGAKGVLKSPAPQVFLESYGEAVEYVLSFWINDYAQVHRISEDVMTTIWYQFRRHGIAFAKGPASEPISRKGSGGNAQLVQALRKIDFLAPVTEPDLALLSEDLTHEIYAEGERIFAQGEAGQTFYLVWSGRVEVRVKNDAGQEVVVAELGPGESFGERSILTGEPRAATVYAKEDSDLLELDRASFTLLLKNNPAVGQAMLDLIKRREAETRSRVEEATARAARSTGEPRLEKARGLAHRLFEGLSGAFGLGRGGGASAGASTVTKEK